MSDSHDVGAGSEVPQSGQAVVAPLIVQLTRDLPRSAHRHARARDPFPAVQA